MGKMFECPYCGIRNKIGQRFCTHCRARFYYTCVNCNNIVDTSYKFCPNCSTSLNWGVKPQANIYLPAGLQRSSKSMPKYKTVLLVVAGVLFLASALVAYVIYQSSLGKPIVIEGYESWQEITTESVTDTTPLSGSQYVGSPPYQIKPGDSFHLINDSSAGDVSFEELKQFIIIDQTDRNMYVPGMRMCGYFAQEVHNNAEKSGIKAAVVIVEFEGSSLLHALNAFQTTDMGLVFIDCTGVRRSPTDLEEWLYKALYPRGQDRMAYIEKGKEYGTIPLEEAESNQYSYYAGYSKGSLATQSFFSQPKIVKSVTVYW